MVTETTPRPGDKLIIEGYDEFEVEQVIKEHHGNDPREIYSLAKNDDGEYIHFGLPSQCLKTIIPMKLSERNKDGTPAWTLTDPGVRPVSGDVLCLLHPKHPEKDIYNAMGLQSSCTASNLPNDGHALESHMAHRHQQEWKTIERAREKAEKREDREIQRAMLEGVSGRTQPTVEEEAPLYESPNPKPKKKRRAKK